MILLEAYLKIFTQTLHQDSALVSLQSCCIDRKSGPQPRSCANVLTPSTAAACGRSSTFESCDERGGQTSDTMPTGIEQVRDGRMRFIRPWYWRAQPTEDHHRAVRAVLHHCHPGKDCPKGPAWSGSEWLLKTWNKWTSEFTVQIAKGGVTLWAPVTSTPRRERIWNPDYVPDRTTYNVHNAMYVTGSNTIYLIGDL